MELCIPTTPSTNSNTYALDFTIAIWLPYLLSPGIFGLSSTWIAFRIISVCTNIVSSPMIPLECFITAMMALSCVIYSLSVSCLNWNTLKYAFLSLCRDLYVYPLASNLYAILFIYFRVSKKIDVFSISA